MMGRADDRADGLPRSMRRLLRFAERRAGRSRGRPQIGFSVAAARAPKLLADATRLAPSARPPALDASVPSRPPLRAVLPSAPLAEAPAFAQVFATPVSDPALRRSFKPVDFQANLSSLTESEIQVVETFLRRRWDLADVPRQWMAWRVSLPILYKLRPNYDVNTFTYEGFLEELLHRYLQQHRFGRDSLTH